ncbi:histone-lysine N-methyltransferase SMYD3 isoform X1 [Tribolium castaneum]|nr:PREDICTED: histone-lysine N-methyltransferase SMYD3 isoform X1 [Tribolium castaneum]|eukprot:XP_970424.2 PREDICTED: histone-lysine N-methyltransferase SMYD3 isoform X1 [Tribolium castaneum]
MAESEMRSKKLVHEGCTIYKEKPFVYVLSSKLRTEYCDFCLKKGQFMKCSGCHYVYYCGKVCQKDGWSVHKSECRGLKRVAPRILPDAARFIARLIHILRKGGDLVKSYYLENCFRMYKDLMSHYPNIKGDQQRMEHFTSLCAVLFEFLGDDSLPNSAELMGMYGRMCINSFNIIDQELQCIGTGMYLGASVIDHSCSPNAVAIFDGPILSIRALQTFQYLDWSQIKISYIDILNTTKDRQSELEAAYYFLCKCPKCLEPEPPEINAAACPNEKCDNHIDTEIITPGDKCAKCDTVVSETFLKRFKEVIEFTDLHLQNMKQLAYFDVCEICLKKQEGVLHKFNIKHVKTLDLAFQSSIDFQKWDFARKFALELVDAFYKYYGHVHPITGLLHLKLGKILLFEENDQLALEHLTKAYQILKIIHGVGSHLFKDELVPLLQQARAAIAN